MVVKHIRQWAIAACIGMVAIGIGGCGGASTSNSSTSNGTRTPAAALPAVTGASSGNPSTRTPITYALPVGQKPNWIFPLVPSTAAGNYTTIQMWRPLFWFGDNGAAKFNPQLSIADPPVFSDGNTKVTITLKPYRWSDGKPVTTRDVQFWINILTAAVKLNATNWLGYAPGGFPDDVANIKYISDSKFAITFKRSYNPQWLLSNILTQLYAIPQHAWDKTSPSGSVGNYDLTPTGAKAVYNFLASASKSLSTWGTNPIWQVVDGPYKIKSFSPGTGDVSFTPNTAYSGPHSPDWGPYNLESFTSDAAETTALLSGDLDVGYLPLNSLGLKGRLESQGDSLSPYYIFTIAYQPLNLNKPGIGSVLSQLYVRQAMQHLVNQPEIIATAWGGYAKPTYGPVPTSVANPYAAPSASTNPYPFDPAAAVSLLKSHGWTVRPGGVSTCSKPGTGAGECGAGVASDAQLQLSLQIAAGQTALAEEAAQMQTEFSKAGISLQITEKPITDLWDASSCNPKTKSGCDWDMINYGGGWTFNAPTFIPTGEVIFATGGAANVSGYSNAKADALIRQTNDTDSRQAMVAYQNYIARQLPVLWMPLAAAQLTVVAQGVRGITPQDPYLQIYPELWSKN